MNMLMKFNEIKYLYFFIFHWRFIHNEIAMIFRTYCTRYFIKLSITRNYTCFDVSKIQLKHREGEII